MSLFDTRSAGLIIAWMKSLLTSWAVRLSLAGFSIGTALGQNEPEPDSAPEVQSHEATKGEEPGGLAYDPAVGLVFETGDGNTSLWGGLRFQLRASSLETTTEYQDSSTERKAEVTRARIKLGGHVFRPWLKVYFEDDFKAGRFLDYRATVALARVLSLRVGQWKSEYNRERVDSSGKQQMVDRSIANYWFTLDRQLGISAMGRLAAGRAGDSSYWLEMLSGLGRGGGYESDSRLWMGRYQWNFLGVEPAFSQSNLKYRDGSAGALSFGLVEGESPYTRFSSAGGGQLPGYPEESGARYRLRQLMQGSYFQAGGFSWQQELHWKQVKNLEDGSIRRLWGGYVQGGFFPSVRWQQIPEPLEVALRLGLVDPDTDGPSDLQKEITLGVNWFFSGHRNKLTADLSFLDLDQVEGGNRSIRFQLQWDVSI